MKKVFCLLLSAVLLLGLTACAKPEEKEADAYTYKSGSTVIAVGNEASPILEKLGSYLDYDESSSCFFSGKDKIYVYASLEVRTYPENGKDYVYMLRLLDDTVATQEGIRIGSSRSDVTKAYGDAHKQTANSLIYKGGDMYLEIFFSGDTVNEIQYQHAYVQEK
ncbi:MAG: hypothetical protein IJW30_02275 [Clostridia bacterium]|nr:hypothetical protein [Clostridia bacterium]